MRVDPLFRLGLTDSLNEITGRENSLSQQLSSGLRVSSASDDPTAAASSVRLGSAVSADAAYTRASSGIASKLQVADSALGSVVATITSALTLAVKGQDGTLDAANVQAIGAQIGAARDAVLGLANTAYAGSYLFSGTATNTRPFALDTTTSPATATYAGDSLQQTLQSPDGQTYATGLPGSGIFSAAGADVLASLSSLAAAYASGNVSAATTEIATLRAGLSTVSAQRGLLGASLNSLEQASTYASTDGANLQAAQSALVATDTAKVATDLSAAEVQQKALLSVLASEGKTSLFDYLH